MYPGQIVEDLLFDDLFNPTDGFLADQRPLLGVLDQGCGSSCKGQHHTTRVISGLILCCRDLQFEQN